MYNTFYALFYQKCFTEENIIFKQLNISVYIKTFLVDDIDVYIYYPHSKTMC